MNKEEIIRVTLDEAFYIHKTIGPGMQENVYKTCLAYRLRFNLKWGIGRGIRIIIPFQEGIREKISFSFRYRPFKPAHVF
jgi:hypothetical protein